MNAKPRDPGSDWEPSWASPAARRQYEQRRAEQQRAAEAAERGARFAALSPAAQRRQLNRIGKHRSPAVEPFVLDDGPVPDEVEQFEHRWADTVDYATVRRSNRGWTVIHIYAPTAPMGSLTAIDSHHQYLDGALDAALRRNHWRDERRAAELPRRNRPIRPRSTGHG
ncbi:hypothetical protein [Gemmatimonas sp.]|uniref:hypothetical protein n=1 Tax=Gemmatimonas sp. TaxID=1962908 RepID=UPI00356A8C0E